MRPAANEDSPVSDSFVPLWNKILENVLVTKSVICSEWTWCSEEFLKTFIWWLIFWLSKDIKKHFFNHKVFVCKEGYYSYQYSVVFNVIGGYPTGCGCTLMRSVPRTFVPRETILQGLSNHSPHFHFFFSNKNMLFPLHQQTQTAPNTV